MSLTTSSLCFFKIFFNIAFNLWKIVDWSDLLMGMTADPQMKFWDLIWPVTWVTHLFLSSVFSVKYVKHGSLFYPWHGTATTYQMWDSDYVILKSILNFFSPMYENPHDNIFKIFKSKLLYKSTKALYMVKLFFIN